MDKLRRDEFTRENKHDYRTLSHHICNPSSTSNTANTRNTLLYSAEPRALNPFELQLLDGIRVRHTVLEIRAGQFLQWQTGEEYSLI